jgi:hypothetical protein
VFLWYLLRYRLSRRLPTVFVLDDDILYFFHESGVYTEAPAAKGGHLAEDVIIAAGSDLVWALIEGVGKSEPAKWLVTNALFPVQSASPDMSGYKAWMKV